MVSSSSHLRRPAGPQPVFQRDTHAVRIPLVVVSQVVVPKLFQSCFLLKLLWFWNQSRHRFPVSTMSCFSSVSAVNLAYSRTATIRNKSCLPVYSWWAITPQYIIVKTQVIVQYILYFIIIQSTVHLKHCRNYNCIYIFCIFSKWHQKHWDIAFPACSTSQTLHFTIMHHEQNPSTYIFLCI